MILALTEEQAIEIRKTGLSVIQFKYCIKNGISIAVYNLRQFLIAAKQYSRNGKNYSSVLEMSLTIFGTFLRQYKTGSDIRFQEDIIL